VSAFSEDRFLDGRVIARQPIRGFRSGLDAVMLAAAVPAAAGDHVLELGCGAGVASLCLAARLKSFKITGIDTLGALVDLANDNARANGMELRAQFIVGDALDPPAALRRSFDHVFANPPFHDDEGDTSPDRERASALQDGGRLGDWISMGLKRVKSQGTFTSIIRADRLAEALAELSPRGVTLFPLWPRSDAPAKRVVLQARKDSRAPLTMLPGLVLHEPKGAYTLAAHAILREGGSLALASPRL
jgi:tRNA1Val (adenine37-N6)-methyltransferase